ncbi:uncharacterized protein PHACADRAFT_194403 [Phanerochaete carnosa HHB-10118-sp]|uniref:Uncharacterized protein n=1 Tax=Phanerochaete carnosa (strain HHB-10118-sp) TaxID=650164 RepID=K5X237_PHACS|nr:uncharacterized protein PHACADRAFT_194403 [Phanerochaete carnosa HHB-10118-sp]EKM56822.1 hypothetical protein PHACADRAFT_194403 [Phanerochaete carnosa HHB-10118-sp]
MNLNAMDISAFRFGNLFQGLKNPAEIKQQYNKLMGAYKEQVRIDHILASTNYLTGPT